MKDKHTANLLQEELKLVCKQANLEFQKVYGYEWDFDITEVQHNQKLTNGEGTVPSDVLTLDVWTTYPDLPGAHGRTDKDFPHWKKKLWQQVIKVDKVKGLTEARVFAYRQLLFFLTMGFITGVINMEPEELEAISTNPN